MQRITLFFQRDSLDELRKDQEPLCTQPAEAGQYKITPIILNEMRSKKTPLKCRFVDDKAEHSGEGSDGGDTDGDEGTATKSDDEFIDNTAHEEEESENLPKLTRKEKERLSKGDWDVITGRISRPKNYERANQRKTVYKDDDEDEILTEDEDFVVEEEDDLEAAMEVSKSVQRDLRASGVSCIKSGAPIRPSGLSLEISKEKPFYLRDSTSNNSPVVNGANGSVVCEAGEKKMSAYTKTMKYLLSNPYYSGKSCVTVAGLSDTRPEKKAKTEETPSKPAQNKERSRIKPLEPNRKLASIFLGQAPPQKPPSAPPQKLETGLFQNKSGEVYFVHPNGRKSPRPGALG